jgi:murein DD-endopeptidase MepM/ murein hydrolase activator NlpD
LHHPSAGVISSEFGVKRFINNIPRNPHLGLDIAAPIGTPIYAAESGLIVLARDFFYRGKNILIDHGFSLKTSYSHLNRMVIQEGDMVKRGEIIGYMGESGRVTGSHLHFEVIFIGEKLNPVFFLAKD